MNAREHSLDTSHKDEALPSGFWGMSGCVSYEKPHNCLCPCGLEICYKMTHLRIMSARRVAGVVWTEVNGVLLGHSGRNPFVIRPWTLCLSRLGSGAIRRRTKLLVGTN